MRNWAPKNPEYNMYQPDLVNGFFRRKKLPPVRSRCDWHYISASINPDGAVAPCCVLFKKEDDFGSIAANAGQPYMAVLNNQRYTSVRDSFAGRRAEPTDLVCEKCPAPELMDYAKGVNKDIALATMIHAMEAVQRPVRRLFGRLRGSP